MQWKGLSLIPTGRGQTHPLNGKNIWEFEKSFHLFPLGRAKLSGVFEKFFVLQKTPSLIWTKGAEMHTHFRAFSRKFFEKKFYPLLIWNYKAKWHPISQKKWENIFSVAGALFCLPKKSLHLFGIGVSKRNLFQRKIFEKDKKICPPEVASKEF